MFKSQRGFSLLEILVVLVITSLVSALLLQGFSYVLHLRSRFWTQLENLRQGAMREYWFRSSVAGLIADYPERADNFVFQGAATRFSGLTIAALDAEAGIPTPFSWRIEQRDAANVLIYQTDNAEPWQIAQWTGKDSQFNYLDSKGRWHFQWPPALGEQTAQLPRAVSLSGQNIPFAWIVRIEGLDSPKPDYRWLD